MNKLEKIINYRITVEINHKLMNNAIIIWINIIVSKAIKSLYPNWKVKEKHYLLYFSFIFN